MTSPNPEPGNINDSPIASQVGRDQLERTSREKYDSGTFSAPQIVNNFVARPDLHQAINSKLYRTAQDEKAAQLLLENGFDVKATNFDEVQALMWAASYGHDAVVHLLLQKGANIEAKDNGAYTALHWAADKGHEVVAQLLLEEGADTEAKDSRNRTALH